MYKRIIIPFQMDMELFNSPLINRNKANYDEITRQIFQVIIYDLKAYNNKLNSLPDVSVLIRNPLLMPYNQNQLINEASNFREFYLRYAMNIYFTCFEYKLFDNGVFNYLLEHINEDSFLLYSCEPINF